MTDLQQWLQVSPLVAILRGVTPEQAVAVAGAVADAGIRMIEVPMNSPQPLASIEAIATAMGDDVLVGVGTLTHTQDAARVASAGGGLAVMPHTDTAVIAAAHDVGLAVMPGVLTPSEAFAAIHAGADALKLFPAQMLPPDKLAAMRAVLPPAMPLLPVGGITTDNMAAYWQQGVAGFGLGSSLYKPGMGADEVGRRASAFMHTLAALQNDWA